MSDEPTLPGAPAEGPAPGWWQASDGNWYPPDQQPGYAAPPPPGYGPPGYGAPPYAQPGYGGPAPAYGQAGYGQAGYGYATAIPKTTNGLAIAALILGCAQFFAWIVTGIPAIICGHVALSQIKRTGQEGRGMAIAGLVLGYVGLLLFIGFILLIVAAADSLDDNGFRELESGVLRP